MQIIILYLRNAEQQQKEGNIGHRGTPFRRGLRLGFCCFVSNDALGLAEDQNENEGYSPRSY